MNEQNDRQSLLYRIALCLAGLLEIALSGIMTVLIISLFLLYTLLQVAHAKLRYSIKRRPDQLAEVCFFHPFASDGGGGEKVLWHMLHALEECGEARRRKRFSLAHSSPLPDQASLKKHVQARFGINLKREFGDNANSVEVYSVKADALRPTSFAVLSILRQGLASIDVIRKIFATRNPVTLVDTIGIPFAYPFCYLMGVSVLSYVHYPLISEENFMDSSKNTFIPLSAILRSYRYSMLQLYKICGKCVSLCAVNSSWTWQRLNKSWTLNEDRREILYPPLSGSVSLKGTDLKAKRTITLVSLSQFRPEKNHAQQLRIFELLTREQNATFVIAGSVRNHEDELYLRSLQKLSSTLGIAEYVTWKINISNDERRTLLSRSLIAIHTMIDEHFGIGVGDYLAAGCITVAHNSGGPKEDILKPAANFAEAKCENTNDCIGFLAETDEHYVNAIKHILNMSEKEKQEIRARAAKRMHKFSSDNFEQAFLQTFSKELYK